MNPSSNLFRGISFKNQTTRKIARMVYRKIKEIKLELRIIRIAPIIREMQNSPDFPASDASPTQHLELTLRGNNETIALLNQLAQASSLRVRMIEEIMTGSTLENNLKDLFDKNGSDKGKEHEYYPIYSRVFEKSVDPLHILEIGIGSKNKKIPSNMGKYGSPGASLKAFREIRSQNTIYGADIDEDTLNLETDLIYIHLDQTSDKSWEDLVSKVPNNSLDLLIDDGLHSPIANLRTLIYGTKLLKPGGTIVIEDIAEKALPVWSLLSHFSQDIYRIELFKCKKSHAIVLESKHL